MLRVKAGDLDQLGLLFERYHQLLFGFFYQRSGHVSLSQDQVQNVFLRVLRYRHNYRGDGEFRTWLFHIARNVHYDHYRKKRIRHTDDVDEWKDQLADDGASPPQQLIRAEEKQHLKTALQRLDPEKREVLLLAKLQGMPYREIGELLGCSEGAVKVRVFRALKELKEVLAGCARDTGAGGRTMD